MYACRSVRLRIDAVMTITDAEKKIKIAWIVGIISGFVTLFFTLVAAASQGGVFDIQGNAVSLWNFLDVA
jgi:hypothetical protein